ncbi:hypothetical protein TEQG_07075 [Trichophyton equinum CBS 127.97]|uniref:Uncharacterized protein n=1 Tax=Trichophyton equinum (strain ATCC MYA-4606 / CBS 127.97) TaxID=559882 RepID=F2Q1T2_TRIEC|nr:hypothetical protein TEQG_07075 [Trichophyton equinum CBS 127.97]
MKARVFSTLRFPDVSTVKCTQPVAAGKRERRCGEVGFAVKVDQSWLLLLLAFFDVGGRNNLHPWICVWHVKRLTRQTRPLAEKTHFSGVPSPTPYTSTLVPIISLPHTPYAVQGGYGMRRKSFHLARGQLVSLICV